MGIYLHGAVITLFVGGALAAIDTQVPNGLKYYMDLVLNF